MTSLVVEAVGALALVEDLGRPGYAAVGVTSSGAADRASLRLANRILGNPESAPGIEILLGGLTIHAERDVVVCVTGAPAPLHVDGHPAPLGTPVTLADGAVLSVGMPVAGLRTYLAVRGGVDEPRVFGSASSDPTQGVGPAPLAVGRRLAVGPDVVGPLEAVDVVTTVDLPVGDTALRVVVGPRDDWCTTESFAAMTGSAWTVTTDGDRVGVRLSGPRLDLRRSEELPSEPLVRGAIQLPPSGQPVVFLADHPTTGGYPVVAVVVDTDTDRLAQLRPGERLRFQVVPRPW